MPNRAETDVLHRGEGARADARPLTTPIYASSTFVFESAAEMEAYPGRFPSYSTAICNPPCRPWKKTCVLEGVEAALVTSSGMAATTTALFGLVPGRSAVQCRHLRRHAQVITSFCTASRGAFCFRRIWPRPSVR
jgi:cystathionine beta-lyase/cystathionine gamma-synthase